MLSAHITNIPKPENGGGKGRKRRGGKGGKREGEENKKGGEERF
jgi:hypothetical protein